MNIKNLLMGFITNNDLVRYYNTTIIYKHLPKSINGLVWLYKNEFTIFLKYGLSIDKEKEILLHELAHIELNQLEQTNKDYLFAFCRQDMEDEADRYIQNILNELK